ncbi:hypothetical protein BYT27DRAFT_7077428 [Phlegmacium glaucopus]|nr:hypothetical protein BYT27DRAFT_7077428 [Phlegmacium glaucopus]
MHYGKTYTQLLASLPPQLREHSIQYRQLKKVIKRIVHELSSLGLTTEVLHTLIEETSHNTEQLPLLLEGSTQLCAESFKFSSIPKVVYELNNGKSTRIEPQLRIWTWVPPVPSSKSTSFQIVVGSRLEGDMINESGQDDAGSLYNTDEAHASEQGPSTLFPVRRSGGVTTISQRTIQEVVIPLAQETEFYNMLTTTLESVSLHLTALQSDVLSSIQNLSDIISNSTHPASAASKFHPHSPLTADAGSVRVKVSRLSSDLYSWRGIFQLYLETEIFESIGEGTRGERSVEESEKRLQLFVERLTQRGLGDKSKFKMKNSAEALTTFLSLILLILNVKKFSSGNTEATRKILKKHAKRTALPLLLPSSISVSGISQLEALLSYQTTFSLPRTLVQAIGETLIPIIPHLDDYSCLICTSIAFKPIRLTCGHLFCVRCLVKMQKRNKNLCPLCRAPSVLAANRNNVDWALLNFMQDWFPLEANEKLLSNEKEASAEELEELGIDPNGSCLLM